MFTFMPTANDPHSTGYVIVNQQGNNTSLSGFEATIPTGVNQSMPQSPLCALYGLNCANSPIIVQVNCASCFQDHIWIHGRDPSDPAGDPTGDIGQEAFAAAHSYPVDPTSGDHECPGWAYFSTYPAATGNSPVALAGNQLQYSSGCGDDVLFGLSLHSGGFTASEYIFINKIHGFQQETHTYQIGNGADNLNPTPNVLTPGLVNVGGNGLNGPHKVTHVMMMGTSENLFVGGTPINPTDGVLTGLEIRDLRFGSDPGYRYLTGNSGYSPLYPTYGCGAGTAAHVPNICPMQWAMKKDFETKWCLQCMIDGFIFENMWPDGQTGESVLIDARVCSGGSVCGIFDSAGNPLTQTNDIRLTNGIVRNAAGGITTGAAIAWTWQRRRSVKGAWIECWSRMFSCTTSTRMNSEARSAAM